jgi:fumarylpyruvate hydrolase
MTNSYVFDPPTVAVAGEPGSFPVRRIFCVGRNYTAHAREMDKNRTASRRSSLRSQRMLSPIAATLPYPPETSNFSTKSSLS